MFVRAVDDYGIEQLTKDIKEKYESITSQKEKQQIATREVTSTTNGIQPSS